jgi:hypothetical protein
MVRPRLHLRCLLNLQPHQSVKHAWELHYATLLLIASTAGPFWQWHSGALTSQRPAGASSALVPQLAPQAVGAPEPVRRFALGPETGVFLGSLSQRVSDSSADSASPGTALIQGTR